MIKSLSLLAIFSFSLASLSHASIPLVVGQTYNTGYNAVTNTPLAPGSGDLYFNLFSFFPAPFQGTPVIAIPDNPTWVQTGGAQWIAPVANQSGLPGTGSPAGVYDYQADFASDFLVPTSITMSGAFAADDGATLYVAGTQILNLPSGGFSSLTPFNYTFTLAAGPQSTEIDFVVNNLNTGNNSSGLLVSNLRFVASGAPEPSTWAMLLGGAALLVAVRRGRLARAS